METLAEFLHQNVRVGDLWQVIDGYRVRCTACAHRCPIPAGHAGVCKVRFHRDGKLYVPWGYVVNVQCERIEKKPFFHALPGALTLSFGMLGCSLHCPYCQNWIISQTLRDTHSGAWPRQTTPEALAKAAIQHDCEAIISTYNEPLITPEWAVEVFKSARAAGLVTGFVSNGYVTPEALEYLRPWVDLFKVDFKTFSDRRYHELGCRLAPILEGLRMIYEMGYWLEVVTLVVPGFNDSDTELRGMAEFLAGISVDIPWHLTGFHAAYKRKTVRDTTAEDLARAVDIGRAAGLRFVYGGNLPAGINSWEDTSCPDCGAVLIRRQSGRVIEYQIRSDGRCPSCFAALPGRWGEPLERKALHATSLPWLSRYCG